MNSNSTVHDELNIMDWNQHPLIESSEMRERDESNDTETLHQTISESVTPESLDFTTLESVLPQAIIEEYLPCPFVDVPSIRMPQFRQALVSLANNFAGLDGVNVGKVIRFLRKESSQGLFQLIWSDLSYSSRAIAQNLFKRAIETGDPSLGDLLLSRKSLGIDVYSITKLT